jgi:hypothetical protein
MFSLTDDDIQKIPPFQRLVGTGILIDKELILARGTASGLSDPGPMGAMMQDLSAIATRSPQVFHTIINVVGSLPDNIRDVIGRLLPQSLSIEDNTCIDVTG